MKKDIKLPQDELEAINLLLSRFNVASDMIQFISPTDPKIDHHEAYFKNRTIMIRLELVTRLMDYLRLYGELSVEPVCETPGCNETAKARGLCLTHYRHWLKENEGDTNE